MGKCGAPLAIDKSSFKIRAGGFAATAGPAFMVVYILGYGFVEWFCSFEVTRLRKLRYLRTAGNELGRVNKKKKSMSFETNSWT
jgi:hypothetical protein